MRDTIPTEVWHDFRRTAMQCAVLAGSGDRGGTHRHRHLETLGPAEVHKDSKIPDGHHPNSWLGFPVICGRNRDSFARREERRNLPVLQ